MNSSTALRFILDGTNWRSGLCSRFAQSSDDLIKAAKDLRYDLEEFKKSPNPIGSLVATAHNNQEFEKFLEHPVDTGTNPGV